MRWLPWVGREMHLAVVAAKNEVIFNLQRHIASLEEQLKNPAPVNVKVEMPTVQVPSQVPSRRRAQSPSTDRPDDSPTDWANVDENDLDQLARIAYKELGGTTTPYVLSKTIQRIKFNIAEAKRAKMRNLLKTAAAAISPEKPRTEAEAQEQGPEYVPAHIRELIESAEGG